MIAHNPRIEVKAKADRFRMRLSGKRSVAATNKITLVREVMIGGSDVPFSRAEKISPNKPM